MDAELDKALADYVRTDRQIKSLMACKTELGKKIIALGGVGVNYNIDGFKTTVSTGVETQLIHEKARALYPERDERMRECLADEYKPSLNEYRRFFSGEEIAQFSIQAPCAVKITVKKK